MFANIINNSLYGEILLLFMGVAYFLMRYNQRKFQKKNGLNNFEFWVYYNLSDLYKFEGYPYPGQRAMEEIKNIRKRINDECKKPTIIYDQVKDFDLKG